MQFFVKSDLNIAFFGLLHYFQALEDRKQDRKHHCGLAKKLPESKLLPGNFFSIKH